MRKIDELQQKLEAVKNEVKDLQSENKIEDAYAKLTEIRDLKKAIEVEQALEAEEIENIENKIDLKGDKKMENKNKAFVNYLRGDATQEERIALKEEVKNQIKESTKEAGGALVPHYEDCSIIELRESQGALQNYITVKPVTTLSGKKTIRVRKSGGTNFVKVGENTPIGKKATPQYKELEYSVDKYGAIYDITNEAFEDSEQDVVKELNKWIGNDSRELRNKLILEELGKKSKVAIANADDIKKVLNKTLNTENAKFAKILTNQDGFHFLDTLKDSDGKYLLQPLVTDANQFKFSGKDVIVMDNTIMPTVETKAPVIIGDLEMSVIMFDRQVVTVKVTTEGGDAYENDLTLLRAIEREDVQTLDSDAFVYGEITVTP